MDIILDDGNMMIGFVWVVVNVYLGMVLVVFLIIGIGVIDDGIIYIVCMFF